MAVLLEARAGFVTRPDEVVGLVWVEAQHGQAERVRGVLGIHREPGLASVRRVPVFVRVRDEIGTVGRECVVIEGNESLFGTDAIPGVTLIGRLPDAVIRQPGQDNG